MFHSSPTIGAITGIGGSLPLARASIRAMRVEKSVLSAMNATLRRGVVPCGVAWNTDGTVQE